MDQVCEFENSINNCEWTLFPKTYSMFYMVTYRINKVACVVFLILMLFILNHLGADY